MKKFLKEFKEFALQGNIMNLAVGVIIGAAFQDVVGSLTDNILSPIIGMFAKQNFDTLQIDVLGTQIKYGAFITSLINFVIMAFIVFLIVKGMNSLMKIGETKTNENIEEKPAEKVCPFCKSKINIDATRCPKCTSELSAES